MHKKPKKCYHKQTETEKNQRNQRTTKETKEHRNGRRQGNSATNSTKNWGNQANPAQKKLIKNITINTILDLDKTAFHTALSDDEDVETSETISSCKFIRSRSVNSNTGRVSMSKEEDYHNLEVQQIFTFPPEDTPLITTQLKTDEDLQQTCRIHLIDMERAELSEPQTLHPKPDLL